MLQLDIKGHKINLSLSDCSANMAAAQIRKFCNATGSEQNHQPPANMATASSFATLANQLVDTVKTKAAAKLARFDFMKQVIWHKTIEHPLYMCLQIAIAGRPHIRHRKIRPHALRQNGFVL